MHSQVFFAFTLLLLSSIIHAWTEISSITRVPAILNPDYLRNGTLDVLHSSANRDKRLRSRLLSNSYKSETGSVIAVPRGAKYLCPVTIGGQTLNLHFDTGSADLWILTSSIQMVDPLSSHHTYNHDISKSFKEMDGFNWHISYQDGSTASGLVGTDVVSLSDITAEEQVFGLADEVSVSFLKAAGDGILGLAFGNINTIQPIRQKTFLDNIESSLKEPLFTVYLPSTANGSYDFGFVDHDKYVGDIWWTHINMTNGFWEFESSSYKIGSAVYIAPGRTGIVDTGSSVSSAFYSRAKLAYLFNCDDKLPSLSIQIGPGFYAEIPPQLMIFSRIDSEDNLCFGSLQSVGSGKQNMYGDILFNAYFGIFDRRGPLLGMARLNA